MDDKRRQQACKPTLNLEANCEPLYKRLPSRDENGRHLSDFMMLIPGLRNLPRSGYDLRVNSLHALLDAHDDVVFADLNTPLNLLWVSVRTRNGVISEVADEIRRHIPEAKLVGHTPLLGSENTRRNRALRVLHWFANTRTRLKLGKPR